MLDVLLVKVLLCLGKLFLHPRELVLEIYPKQATTPSEKRTLQL
jgi:hypothetical protein